MEAINNPGHPKVCNVLRNPDDLVRATRIISCLSNTNCSRTIVEYVGSAPETRHDHLPAEIMETARALPGVEIIMTPCNHHGGQEYSINQKGNI